MAVNLTKRTSVARKPKTVVPARRLGVVPTLEDRLEAKAARGDRADYTGPSLDEMTREQRHKLLYGA